MNHQDVLEQQDLSGKDLSGRDLCEIDLEGRYLKGVIHVAKSRLGSDKDVDADRLTQAVDAFKAVIRLRDEDDSEREAEQEARWLDYELTRAKAHLKKVGRWERDIQHKAQLQVQLSAPRSHRASNAAALRDITG